MKVLKLLGSGIICVVMILSSTVQMSSCTKTTTINDTTTVIIHDTIIKTDTLVQTDTVCHLDIGLVAHYTFTDGSLLDQTDYHNDIESYSATVTAGISGEANSAYLFDGSSSYMRVPNSPSLNPQNITLMARIRVDGFYQGTCHFSELVGKGHPDNVNGFYVLRIADPFGHCYELPDETKEFFIGGFGNNIPEGTAAGVMGDTSYIQKDHWYTVVYTYDGSTSKIYVNGKMKAEQQKTASFTANDQDLFIGRHGDPNFPYWFNGVIDEVRIYNRAIKSKEVEMLSCEQ